MKLTPVQTRMLEALSYAEADGAYMTARGLAYRLWPDDEGWQHRTAGRGASGHNGAKGGTMPMRAGRVLSNLTDKGLVRNHATDSGPRAGYWFVTPKGREVLEQIRVERANSST